MNQQESFEQYAMSLLEKPELAEAIRHGQELLRASVPDADPVSLEKLPAASVETALNALLNVVNHGLTLPQPRLIMRLPRENNEGHIPGTRGLHDNPDTFYRIIPVSSDSDFILEGVFEGEPGTIVELSLLSRQWETLANFSKPQLLQRHQRKFRVQVGQEQAEEDTLFMRSRDDVEMLIVRETLSRWGRQQPCALHLSPVQPVNQADGIDLDGEFDKALERVRRWFEQCVALQSEPLSLPANTMPQPVITSEFGKLVTQAYAIGHFDLAEGQAMIITVSLGSASYFVVPVTNLWGVSENPASQQSSLNNDQAVANADGSYTFVVSPTDPGVLNWVDTSPLRRGFLFLRWAGLDPAAPSSDEILLATRTCTINELQQYLPADTRWIDPVQREQALLRRQQEHLARYTIIDRSTN
tara:strand:+ start:7584 stop:8825 length:1242 start_codon:yes stop_codon:yes gene_type:complete